MLNLFILCSELGNGIKKEFKRVFFLVLFGEVKRGFLEVEIELGVRG